MMNHEELSAALKACKHVEVLVSVTKGYPVRFEAKKGNVHNLLVTHTGCGMQFNAELRGDTLVIGESFNLN